MAQEIKVPSVGESVTEGMIAKWHKKSGDVIAKDQILFELETDKATVEIVAETAGVLTIQVEAGKIVKPGQIVGLVTAGTGTTTAAASSSNEKVAATPSATPIQTTKQVTSQDSIVDKSGPAVKRMVAEENINTQNISGTGRDGRITKEDLLRPAAPTVAPQLQKSPVAPSVTFSASQGNGERIREDVRKPMSMIRRRIAERLLYAQHQAAILTTFNEIDMTTIMALREKYKDAFNEKHGVKLGFMSFFVKAAVQALKAFPEVNAYIDNQDLIYHSYCDVGVAVSTEKGLMVPIVRNADQKSIADLEKSIAEFAVKARQNKISLDDLTGGTFTVSNGGVFGSLMSTPILNPPQSAILGMHKTMQRPMVMPDGSIQARPMMYIAMSYDHRIIDGKEAVGFLVKVKEGIEDPSRFLLEV